MMALNQARDDAAEAAGGEAESRFCPSERVCVCVCERERERERKRQRG